MSGLFELDAVKRADEGKGASRRLRRLESKVPGVVYGAGKKPESISLELKALIKALENEAFFSHILTLNLDGSAQKVVVKDVQRHPAKNMPIHIDLLRIDADRKIHMSVPLHFLNEETCHGVKMEGGIIAHLANEVEIICLPGNLPEYLEVDMAELKTGDSVHLTDLKLPEGVELAALAQGIEDHDIAIANVSAPKGSADEDEEEGDAANTDESASDS